MDQSVRTWLPDKLDPCKRGLSVTASETSNQARFAGMSGIVTGAGSGIGRATAVLLAQQGAKVVAADVDEPGMIATVETIVSRGGVGAAQSLNVTSESAWETVIGHVERTWGKLDVLVNCAGIALVRP